MNWEDDLKIDGLSLTDLLGLVLSNNMMGDHWCECDPCQEVKKILKKKFGTIVTNESRSALRSFCKNREECSTCNGLKIIHPDGPSYPETCPDCRGK